VQVQAGDTLAAIAMRNYKRVSPRLLDEICKANNMRNANVLSLGQKLTLPSYNTQPTQIAGAGQVQ
jgi:nucleoid-associated protein YgaU